MIHWEELITKTLLQKTASIKVRRLFLMKSKTCYFICSRSKKHRMSSEVCNNMEADVMRLAYISCWDTMFIKKKFRAVVSTVEKLPVFFAEKGHPMSINLRQYLPLFESELFAMDRAALFRWRVWLGLAPTAYQQQWRKQQWQTIAICLNYLYGHHKTASRFGNEQTAAFPHLWSRDGN